MKERNHWHDLQCDKAWAIIENYIPTIREWLPPGYQVTGRPRYDDDAVEYVIDVTIYKEADSPLVVVVVSCSMLGFPNDVLRTKLLLITGGTEAA